MSIEKMREQFEGRFPVPEGIIWNGALDLYHTIDPDPEQFHGIVSMLYRARWEAWQASRDAVVVELPDVANYEVYDQQRDFLHTDEVTLMEAVGMAIEAQGLKVAP